MREDLIVVHSLQVGADADDLDEFSNYSNLHNWNDVCLISLIQPMSRQLDLVITIDTGVAHLAGALGVPTYFYCTMMPTSAARMLSLPGIQEWL